MKRNNNYQRQLVKTFRSVVFNYIDKSNIQPVYYLRHATLAGLYEQFSDIKNLLRSDMQRIYECDFDITFYPDGVLIRTSKLKEQKYICRSQVVARWGGYGRELMKMFCPKADKEEIINGRQKFFYLTSRIKEIETSDRFNKYKQYLFNKKKVFNVN